jgi:hypothetical protein
MESVVGRGEVLAQHIAIVKHALDVIVRLAKKVELQASLPYQRLGAYQASKSSDQAWQLWASSQRPAYLDSIAAPEKTIVSQSAHHGCLTFTILERLASWIAVSYVSALI